MYSLLLAIIYLAFISLGLPDSLLGASWPTLYSQFDVPISYMGYVTMIISLGTIISSLLCDRVVAKLGTRWVTFISILLTSVALFGFSLSDSFIHICLWGIPYGLGAGAIDASLNNYVALHYNSRHMSWLHCFWGVGTIVSPYIMSYALTLGGWADGYRIVSIIQISIALIVLVSFPIWKINKKKEMTEVEVKPIGLTGVVKIKGALPVLLGFLAYCATESTTALWASSYFEGVFSLTKETAAALGSLAFIGITAGRFAAGFITERLGDTKMIRLGAVIALGGIILIALPVKELAIAGFVLIGVGCAPIYPSIIHSTPERFGKEKSQSIIGIQMAFAYLGSTLMPPLFGVIARYIDLRLMPAFLAVFLIAMFILLEKANKQAPVLQKKQ